MRRILPALLVLPLFLMPSCAKQQFPPGGPEDKTPPEVLSVEPENGSAQISRKPVVSVSFSERMDRQRTREAVFVSPPPDGGFQIDWKKNTLRITFEDSLAADRTYLVTIGSGATDQRNNRLAESFSLAFSTGETLDSGSISGTVRQDGLPLQGATVVVHHLDSVESPGLLSRLPEYLTQTGSDGTYKLSFVSPGDYVLFAIDDKNSNRQWDPPRERIGLPLYPALIGSGNSVAEGVDFHIIVRDTVPLKVEKATISRDRVLKVDLAGSALRRDLMQCSVILVTEDTQDSVRLDRVFAWGDSVTSFVGIIPDLDETETFFLQIDSLFDVWGNPISTVDDSIMLQYPVGVDKRSPAIVEIDPPSGSQDVALTPIISVRFDEPVRIIDSLPALTLLDPDSVDVNCRHEQYDEFTIEFSPDDTLAQGTKYQAALQLGSISDLAGNRSADSTVVFGLKTVNYDSLGSFSGNVLLERIGAGQMPMIFFKRIPSGELTSLEYEPSGRFYRAVTPGKYIFTGFTDRNGDGFFSAGKFSPFEYAEPVLVFGDTITVRSRFETEGIELKIE